MVWVCGVAFVVVLALAAWAATGRLGEMPEPINDRPKAFVPDLLFGSDFMSQLRLPVVSVGYERRQVDEFLQDAQRQVPASPPLFDIAAGGYDMQAVDVVIGRIADTFGLRPVQSVPGGQVSFEAAIPAAPGPAGAPEPSRMRNNRGVHLDSKD